MANLKEKILLFRRAGRQLRVTATEFVDLGDRLDDAFRFPDGGVMTRRYKLMRPQIGSMDHLMILVGSYCDTV